MFLFQKPHASQHEAFIEAGDREEICLSLHMSPPVARFSTLPEKYKFYEKFYRDACCLEDHTIHFISSNYEQLEKFSARIWQQSSQQQQSFLWSNADKISVLLDIFFA